MPNSATSLYYLGEVVTCCGFCWGDSHILWASQVAWSVARSHRQFPNIQAALVSTVGASLVLVETYIHKDPTSRSNHLGDGFSWFHIKDTSVRRRLLTMIEQFETLSLKCSSLILLFRDLTHPACLGCMHSDSSLKVAKLNVFADNIGYDEFKHLIIVLCYYFTESISIIYKTKVHNFL